MRGEPEPADTSVGSPAPQPPLPFTPDVQVTATRREETVRIVPQSITVLGRDLLDSTLARRADDVMELVPGVQAGLGFGGTWDDWVVRGFRTWAGTTYRNGFLNGYSGQNATDAVNLERVEVIRGPAAALYGPSLPGGSINFVTKRPEADRRASIRLFAGSHESVRGEVDLTGPLDGAGHVLYRLTGAADTTEGYRDFNDFHRWIVNPVVQIELQPGTRLLVDAQAYEQRYRADGRGVPMVGGDPFALPLERSFTEPDLPLASIRGGLVRTEIRREVSDAVTVRIGTQLQAGGYEEPAVMPLFVADDGRTLVRLVSNWESRSRSFAVQAAVDVDFATGPLRHRLTGGLDASYESVDWRFGMADPAVDPFAIDVFEPRYGQPRLAAPLPDGPENLWTYRLAGAWVNDVVQVASGVDAMIGLRADAYEQTSTVPGLSDRAGEVAPSARAGLVVRIVDALSVYGSASRGFWPVLGVAAGGGLLAPERNVAFELGTRLSAPEDAVRADLVLFHLTDWNISVPDPDNPDFQVQRGEARSMGAELSVDVRLSRVLRAIASYAYTRAEVTDDPDPANVGRRLPLTARHAGAAWAEATPGGALGGLFLGLGGAATSERALLDGAQIPGYARLDASVGYRTEHVSATLRVHNLLDSRWVRSGTDRDAILPGAPRSFLLELRGDL